MRTKSLLCECIVLLVMVVTTATPCFAVNLIYGCVKSGGGLEIVSGPGQCKANQTPISWPAEGLTAVHGAVLANGDPDTDSEGFTSEYVSGVYYITFETPFTGSPNCVISLLGTPPPSAFCAILGQGPSILDVNCITPTIQNGILVYEYSQVPFSFICIE
jgi:hypothetical protein